jgi:hypothetical protein
MSENQCLRFVDNNHMYRDTFYVKNLEIYLKTGIESKWK